MAEGLEGCCDFNLLFAWISAAVGGALAAAKADGGKDDVAIGIISVSKSGMCSH